MTAKPKRNLFQELQQGVQEMEAHKVGKMTLRTHKIAKMPALKINADFIRRTRQELNMSRGVFARKLRISPRTLEKWEQGESTPNDQAAVLILMVNKFPDTLNRLENI